MTFDERYMKKAGIIALAGTAALVLTYAAFLAPGRLEKIEVAQLHRYRDFFGFDFVSDRYGVKDASLRTMEDVIGQFNLHAWGKRYDATNFVCLKTDVVKWPIRYEYTVKIYRSDKANPEELVTMGVTNAMDYIEMWYIIKGKPVWTRNTNYD